MTAQQSCLVEATMLVTILPKPSAAFTFSVNGLSAMFQNGSSNAGTWLWSFGDGQSSTLQNPSHSYATVGSFTVTLTSTSANGCGSATVSQAVNLACPPVLVAVSATGSTAICAGQSVVLNATTGFQNYVWQKNGAFVSGSGAVFSASEAGNYAVLATDAGGCSGISQGILVTEKPLPSPAFSVSTNSLTAAFSNNSANSTAFSWNFGDGSPSSSVANPTHSFSADGTYSVILTASNDCGSATSAQAVAVGCSAAVPTISPDGPTQFCEGQTVALVVSAGNFSIFQWFKDGVVLPNSNVSSLLAAESGIYQLQIADAAGCLAVSNMIPIEVAPPPVASITTAGNGTVCEGAATWLHGAGGVEYQWITPTGLQVGGQEILFPSSLPAQSGTYFLTITDGAGCTAATSFLFTVDALPQVSIIGLATAFSDQDPSVVLVGMPAGGGFSGAGVSGASFDPAAAGVGQHVLSYFFTDSNGCSATASQVVTVSHFVATNAASELGAFEIFPNPSDGAFWLKMQLMEPKKFKISLFNTLGQTLETRFTNLPTGHSSLFFDQKGQPSGTYFLEILDEKTALTTRLLISKYAF